MDKPKYRNKLEQTMANINDLLYANTDIVFSHADLAEKVGVSRQAIAKIFHQESVPSYPTAMRIYKAVNEQLKQYGHKPVDLEELFPVPDLPPEQEFSYVRMSNYSFEV